MYNVGSLAAVDPGGAGGQACRGVRRRGDDEEVISFGGYVWGIRDKLSHLAQVVPVLRGVRFAEYRYDPV
ncbi:hypothetical protein SNE510_72720 [Streptomyces sp. NE5-10]|nr:hypothetical protein SNE510_72720 [Streptomyces sp. NE5-10]